MENLQDYVRIQPINAVNRPKTIFYFCVVDLPQATGIGFPPPQLVNGVLNYTMIYPPGSLNGNPPLQSYLLPVFKGTIINQEPDWVDSVTVTYLEEGSTESGSKSGDVNKAKIKTLDEIGNEVPVSTQGVKSTSDLDNDTSTYHPRYMILQSLTISSQYFVIALVKIPNNYSALPQFVPAQVNTTPAIEIDYSSYPGSGNGATNIAAGGGIASTVNQYGIIFADIYDQVNLNYTTPTPTGI